MFENKLLLTTKEVASAIGISDKTIRNKICKKDFPIRSVVFCRRQLFARADVLEFVEKLLSSPELQQEMKRGPGRPRKISPAKING